MPAFEDVEYNINTDGLANIEGVRDGSVNVACPNRAKPDYAISGRIRSAPFSRRRSHHYFAKIRAYHFVRGAIFFDSPRVQKNTAAAQARYRRRAMTYEQDCPATARHLFHFS